MKICDICSRIIEYSFYFLFFLVPLILTPWNYELFEYNKMMAVYGVTAIIVGTWLAKMIAGRQLVFRRTALDIPILLFLLSQVLSTIFSLDRHVSLWGYYSRFHGGLLSTISYILLYYALVSNLPKGKVINLLKISLLSASVVALYGILEHFGIDKNIWVQDVQNRVFSTLGQPNWLAAYLAILIPVVMAFTLKAKSKMQIFVYYLLLATFYLCLLYTKSRSGIFAFAIAYLIFWLFIGLMDLKNIKKLVLPFAICNLLFAITTIVVGTPWTPKIQELIHRSSPITNSQSPITNSGPALEVGGTESGTIRQIVWRGAIDIWRHYPIFGSGVETFAFSYYQFRPTEHNLVSEWDFLYNKAHNEYLNFAATTGSVGLGTYLLFIFVFLWWFMRNFKKLTDGIFLGLLAGWLSILITNFFGFSVVPVAIYFYLIPAMAVALNTQHPTPNTGVKMISSSQKAALILVLFAIGYSLFTICRMWYADTRFNQGYQLSKAGHYKEAYTLFHESISLVPNEPFYRDELAYPAAVLAVATSEQKEPELSRELAEEAIAQNKIALTTSPSNVNFWKTRTKVFYALSNLDEKYSEDALTSILMAQKLAPTDAKIAYNVGILYGKVGNTQMAVKSLEETVVLKPDYKDARYALGLYYNETGKRQQAVEQMDYILTKIASDDGQTISKLKDWGAR